MPLRVCEFHPPLHFIGQTQSESSVRGFFCMRLTVPSAQGMISELWICSRCYSNSQANVHSVFPLDQLSRHVSEAQCMPPVSR